MQLALVLLCAFLILIIFGVLDDVFIILKLKKLSIALICIILIFLNRNFKILDELILNPASLLLIFVCLKFGAGATNSNVFLMGFCTALSAAVQFMMSRLELGLEPGLTLGAINGITCLFFMAKPQAALMTASIAPWLSDLFKSFDEFIAYDYTVFNLGTWITFDAQIVGIAVSVIIIYAYQRRRIYINEL